MEKSFEIKFLIQSSFNFCRRQRGGKQSWFKPQTKIKAAKNGEKGWRLWNNRRREYEYRRG